MRPLRLLLTLLACAWLPACATPATMPAPATAPVFEPKAATAEPFVIAANPLAARAGLNVLERGGSAVDAAIAIQAMLSLVEPQSSGVGGGAFMTYYDGRTGKVSVLDGREVAPAQTTPTMFLRPDGSPLSFDEAVLSGRATGVPGVVRMLAMAHEERGKLPWNSLFGDAEKAAREGFIVSPRLARMVHANYAENHAPDVVAYFSQGPGGRLVEQGDRLANPAYADFLERLADQGPSALYSGSTAARIVERTRAGPLGGSMTMADLANYRPARREALCRPYRVYLMCVPPPESSGVGLIQLMKLLEGTDIAQRGPDDPQSWYIFAEASRIMYADRDRYVGDVPVPVDGLLDPAYVASRRRLIGPTAGPPPMAGTPKLAPSTAADSTYEPTGTSHLIVRDSDGSVVSMTTTVESIFGSGRMVDGFFLNNQMTDFAFRPTDDEGRPAANAIAPGKRPRSSMTPTILLTTDGRFAGAIGSAGGNAIIAYVAKSLVAAIDWNMPMREALAAPNLVARRSAFQGEVTRFAPEILEGLRRRGIDLEPGQGEDSGVTGVLIRDGRIDGGADPRREGVVLTLPSRP
jgi:gamma-glutamyltranspeptidase / glutathione hydrolase